MMNETIMDLQFSFRSDLNSLPTTNITELLSAFTLQQPEQCGHCFGDINSSTLKHHKDLLPNLLHRSFQHDTFNGIKSVSNTGVHFIAHSSLVTASFFT